VLVGVLVAVLVGVLVAVLVGMLVAVGGIGVFVAVVVGVLVAVGVGSSTRVKTNSGGVLDSFDSKTILFLCSG
jgi:CDP-diglyceride synthetase